MVDDRNLVDEVIETERRWARAHLELDLAAIAEILSDEYRQIRLDGSVGSKADLLDSYGSGERMWQIAESSGHEVWIRGDTAILRGSWRGKGVNAGESFDYMARFLAIYVREDGDWKLWLEFNIPIETGLM